jgi:BirA family biotin operon repressor/biotin-[acetyl-CoA-carboxylase] ligase
MMPFEIEHVRRCLSGRSLAYFESIDSTMHEAARLASAGCVAGTAVVAGEQTSGQGRHGRSWHSEPGAGLYASVVLRPPVPTEALPVLTLALGLATAEAIARSTDLRCDLRWPNDVMLNGKKVAGILVQLVDTCCIAGIGINVNHRSFPPDLASVATSLHLETGKQYSREQLLINLLQAVDSFGKMLADGGKRSILDMFARSSSYARNKKVVVHQGDSVLRGMTAGLNESGFLLLRQEDGTDCVIVAGGVRLA